MGALYSGTSVSGYNANPPSDDGTQIATNQIGWNATIKAKIGDPLNTAIVAMDSNVTSAFGKTISGASVVSTNSSYPMSAADQGRSIIATASGITITTPDATSVHAPFVFFVNNNSSGTITLAGFGSQNIDSNNSNTLGPKTGCFVATDGSNWFTSGLVMGNIRTQNPPYGFDAPINFQLNASVNSNILGIAVKGNNGSDPSPSNPVLIPFRDSTLTSGDPVWVAVTSALSISTNAAGATLGSQNAVPFRFWVVAFNNAGTAVLALWHSGAGAATTALNPLNEATLQSTTGISAAATSAGTFYTPNGTTLSNKAFRILGYIEYSGGLTTAGNYATVPTTIQLFGPGIYKPGSVIQSVQSAAASLAIIPTSAINLVNYQFFGSVQMGNGGGNGTWSPKRGTTNIGTTVPISAGVGGGANAFFPIAWSILDAPATTSSTTYQTGSSGGVLQTNYILLSEIMG